MEGLQRRISAPILRAKNPFKDAEFNAKAIAVKEKNKDVSNTESVIAKRFSLKVK